MSRILTFSDPINSIKELFIEEKIKIQEKLLSSFIDMLPSLLNYEEEGVKIKPSIIFCADFHKCFCAIDGLQFFKLTKFEKDKFFKILKSVIPFCLNDFILVFAFKDCHIEIGLLKNSFDFNKKQLKEVIETKKNEDGSLNKKYGFIWFKVANSLGIDIMRNYGEDTHINFGFFPDKTTPSYSIIESFSKECCSGISKNNKENMELIIKNIFLNVLYKAHGTIILVMKGKNHDGILEDGIWLEKPISFLKSRDCQADLYNKSVILEKMINYDGITVFNDKCEILAYNVMISSEKCDKTIVGGARKRAFITLSNYKIENFKSVLFKSQDGNIEFRRIENV